MTISEMMKTDELNTYSNQKLSALLFQTTFSVTQLITAVIGSVLAFIIWIPLKKVIAEQN